MLDATFATPPDPEPQRPGSRRARAVVVLALPVFVIAGWRLGAWAHRGRVLWVVFQGVGYLLARLPLGMDNLGSAGVVAIGRMLRAVVLMAILDRRHRRGTPTSGLPAADRVRARVHGRVRRCR